MVREPKYTKGLLLRDYQILSKIRDSQTPLLHSAVCSPGGSTIMGVKALEDGGFRSSLINAVIAAYDKTKALGK